MYVKGNDLFSDQDVLIWSGVEKSNKDVECTRKLKEWFEAMHECK